MLEIECFTGGIAATNGYTCACKARGTSFLVDAPEGIAEWLEGISFEPQALLLTHAHFDHVLDVELVQKRWKIPIYAFAQPTPELTLKEMAAAFGVGDIPSYKVDHLVAEGVPITLGDLTFETIHVPGHSLDSLVFLENEAQVIFGGDVLMQGGVGRSDFPGGDGELLKRGIREKLFVLDDQIKVFSGHGPATTIGAEKRGNPYVRS